MAIKQFRLDRKAAGAQALEGLWGPGPPGDLLYDMAGVGKGNHATRAGTGPRSQMSDRGRVMLFNGVDDEFLSERALGINLSAFTFCAWAWLDSTVVPAFAAVCGAGSGGAADEYEFRVSNSNGVNARLKGYGDTGLIDANGPVGSFHAVKDQWAHVAMTRDADAVYLYQDGIQVGSDLVGVNVNLNTAKVFEIGCSDSNAIRWWKGMIDDVRYYTRALSIGEITHIYRTTRYRPYADILLRPTRRYVHRHRAASYAQ